ncbi:hypothetical protein C5S29_00185, partial [ANME-1 cluster archaeon GoMg3.2]|nr:hypothetical protein [ANME-1 cluster archaeon GoMg3.2]
MGRVIYITIKCTRKVRTMVEVKIKIALVLIAILILAAPIVIAQEVPAHVVISEVQIATNEFVELYNPTNSAIEMTDWHWCYFSPTRNWNDSYRDKTFPGGAIIPAHGFYLIATTSGDFPTADWNLEYATHFLKDTAGSVGIFPWDPDTKTAEEAKAGKIDAVGWGSVTDVYETATASTPSSGESIERKPLKENYAPCQDTDNNALDFVVQETPTPKNSSSLETGISVTKVGDVTEAAPSTLVYFNIIVNNTGKCRLDHVLVEDMLPAGMTYSSSDPLADSTNGTITWDDVGPLAVNASTTITLVAQIEEDAKGVLTNTVDVTGTPRMGTNVYDDATAEVRVICVAIEKSCKSSTTSLGKTVKYTIEYSNPGKVNLTNVVITENYPKDLTFTSAVPAPDSGTNNKWTIGTLPVGESGKITIKMKVPASMTDFSYTESGSVSGEGIVMISKELSTKVEPFDLENIVTISGSYGATNVSATASAITTVSVSGSSLEITEHGSGTYDSEEELSVSPEKMGIKFDKTTNAKYSPTTFKCSDGFVMEVPSKWSQDICIKNYVKKSAIHKTIT